MKQGFRNQQGVHAHIPTTRLHLPGFSGLTWQWQKEINSHLHDQAPTWFTTISDSLPLQHIPFWAISTPPLKKLLEAQVPISLAWLLPQPEVWRNKVSAFGSGFIKKPPGNTDGKTGQWVSWVSTCRSFIIWFQVLWDTKTQNLFELGTECDPIFHFTKKRHQSLIWGHMHWKLELQGPHPWPVLLLPHYHAASKRETWNPSVFENPHLLQYSIRIENKDS